MKKRIATFILTILMIIPITIFYPWIGNDKNNIVKATKSDEEPIEMTIILERMYVDGELSQETVVEKIWSLEDFWAKYDDWQLIEMKKAQLVFRKNIDDISPLLKANGYFGITNEGVFTIFNGRPRQTNIIQSFFQIDLGKLESKKWEELKKGIPIKTKEQYVEVIETFKVYSKMKEDGS